MTFAKKLSVIVTIGMSLLILVTFGFSWDVLIIGTVLSAIGGSLYHKLLIKLDLGV